MDEEQEAIAELKAMSSEELDMVEHKMVWWICCCKGCNSGSKLRDFGIHPEYWNPKFKWIDVSKEILYCGKHWKLLKRLEKRFDRNHIARRLIDFEKDFILTNEEKKAATPPRKKTLTPVMKRRK